MNGSWCYDMKLGPTNGDIKTIVLGSLHSRGFYYDTADDVDIIYRDL